MTSVRSILSPVSRSVGSSWDTLPHNTANCSGPSRDGCSVRPQGHTDGPSGQSEEALRWREIDRSKQERLLRSAELATPETSGLVRWNYFTHCQINILCSSLSAISVMVGNGVTFSYKNIHFSLGSQNIFTTKCD